MQRYYSDALLNITLADEVNSTATSLTMSGSLNLPAVPFEFCLDYLDTYQEVCLCTAVNTSTNVWTVTRNYDGGGAQGHNAEASVNLIVSVPDYEEANNHHTGNTDSHLQYYTLARHAVESIHIAGENIPVGTPSVSNVGDLADDPGSYLGGYAALDHIHGRETLATLQQMCWPTGAVGFFLDVVTSPIGWLPADGRAIQVLGDPTLFNEMAYAYGGSTNNYVIANPYAPAWSIPTNTAPPANTTYYYNLPNIPAPAPNIVPVVKMDPGYNYIPKPSPGPVPPAQVYTPPPPVQQPLFVGPGYVVTVWQEYNVFNIPGDDLSGLADFYATLFFEPGEPSSITWIQWSWLAAGQAWY